MTKITKMLAAPCNNMYAPLRIILLFCCLAGFSMAQSRTGNTNSKHDHTHPEPAPSETKRPSMKLNIPDVDVLTQDGKPVKFYTDLVKGKKVMINFAFTSCRYTCPVAGRNLQKLQEQIGVGLGKDIFLVTVSTDPAVDTPGVLKKWGERFGRRDGWTLVTGDEKKIDEVLFALTGNTRQPELEHTALLVLYDGVSGNWGTTTSVSDPRALLYDLSKLGKKP